VWLQKSVAWLYWIGLAVFIYDVVHFSKYMPLHESLAIAILICVTSLRPESLPGRLFEWNFLKSTGMLSYSIYIRQGLFFRTNWGRLWPVLLVSSVSFSYVIVEQPARKFGRRLANRYLPDPPLSVNRVDAEEAALAVAGIPSK
jgi:peptidoglycan/LPS O-acetylase OafA/YrhL